MIDILPFTCETRFDQVLFKALMLPMYYGCLRVGDAILLDQEATHTLTANAVRPSYANGQIEAYLTEFNSFKHSNGRNCILKLQRSVPESYCPVLALWKYMLVQPRCRSFLFLDNVGRPLHRRTLLKVMRMALVQAGMNKFSLNTHSFRMGALHIWHWAVFHLTK